jgi:hypothetical protein
MYTAGLGTRNHSAAEDQQLVTSQPDEKGREEITIKKE